MNKYITLILCALLMAGCGGAPNNEVLGDRVPAILDGGEPPQSSLKYMRLLKRYSQHYVGHTAPVALYAAQIDTESNWRANVSSPYADGLVQVTPGTEGDLKRWYPDDLSEGNRFDPAWSIRAMLLYNSRLKNNMVADTECDDHAFVLAAYNGGSGHILNEKNLAEQNGDNRNWYWGSVENYRARNEHAYEENRNYPIRIIIERQGKYRTWQSPGLELVCEK